MTSDEIQNLNLPMNGPIDREEAKVFFLKEITFQLARWNELFRAALSVQFPDHFE